MKFPWTVSPRLRLTLALREAGPLSWPLSELSGRTQAGHMKRMARYTHNDLGEVLEHPKHSVTDLSVLHPADLISFQRSLLPDTHWMGYWHFAIVESVNLSDQTVRIIHYQPVFDDTYKAGKGHPPSKFEKGRIVATTLSFADEQIWLVEIDHTECLPAEEVLIRARSRLQENLYNVLLNNCENFAYWCKTGSSRSTQSHTATTVAVQQGSRAVTKFAAKKATEKAIAKGLLRNTASQATSVGAQAGRLTRVTGLFSAVDAVMSAGFTMFDILKAKKKLKEGQIDKSEYRKAVTTILAVRTGDVSCAFFGTLAGSALAGPPGAFVGGTVGSAVGTVLGSATANVVFKGKDT